MEKHIEEKIKLRELENARFWNRLGGKPALKGASVLEIGCGYGVLCVDMALSGARLVIGLDISSKRIDVARKYVKEKYPQLKNIIEFKVMDLKDYPAFNFDYIFSKNSFEHIIELEKMLIRMKSCLKLGGKVYTGFGPLYNSPFGDHGLTKTIIPWGHLLIKESIIINKLNRRGSDKINSIYDLGLNKLSFSDYLRIFNNSGLYTIYFRVNQSNNIIVKIFSLFSKIPFLKEYFTQNIYCILEKTENSPA